MLQSPVVFSVQMLYDSNKNAPLFPWTWELWEFLAASRQPRRLSSNEISGKSAKLPPPSHAWTNQKELSCQTKTTHNQAVIDVRRWKGQVMAPLVFNKTTTCVNLSLKKHACSHIYTEGKGHADQPHTDTSAHLYLYSGTYQDGQPLHSSFSRVDTCFIICPFSSKIREC